MNHGARRPWIQRDSNEHRSTKPSGEPWLRRPGPHPTAQPQFEGSQRDGLHAAVVDDQVKQYEQEQYMKNMITQQYTQHC